MTAEPAFNLHTLTVPIPVSRSWPIIVTPPADRRHRWVLTSEGERRRWFRCSTCGRRRSVTVIASVIGAKMIEAQRGVTDYLNQHLFGRQPPEARRGPKKRLRKPPRKSRGTK